MSQQSNPATLRELVRRWNEVASKIANRPTSTPETRAQATGWKQCADELEEALAASGTEAAPSVEINRLRHALGIEKDSPACAPIPGRDVSTLSHESLKYLVPPELHSPAQAAASPEREGRTIQEVLRLHVSSSESMRETFKRVGHILSEATQSGVTAGLKRAIEIADNLTALRQSAAPSVGEALVSKLRDLPVHKIGASNSSWDDVEPTEYVRLSDLNALLAQESQTGAAPSPSPLRHSQGGPGLEFDLWWNSNYTQLAAWERDAELWKICERAFKSGWTGAVTETK